MYTHTAICTAGAQRWRDTTQFQTTFNYQPELKIEHVKHSGIGWLDNARVQMCVQPHAQAAVYTARAGKGSQRRIKARTCHAPARRLARTTISLGPEEGILFGLRAIRWVYRSCLPFTLCVQMVRCHDDPEQDPSRLSSLGHTLGDYNAELLMLLGVQAYVHMQLLEFSLKHMSL